MYITINIVLDVLANYNLERCFPQGENPEFKQVSLLPRSKGTPLTPSCLYIGRLSDAIDSMPYEPEYWFVLLRDRIHDDKEQADDMHNMIIVNENTSLEIILNKVQQKLFDISDWVLSMKDALIDNKGVQYILDLCVPIINNFVSVVDSSMKLVAYTPQVPCDDTIVCDVVAKGYHSDRTLQQFKKTRRFEIWNNSSGIIINESYELSPYVLITYVFKYNSTFYCQLVMTCNQTPYSEGLMDLFQLLINALSVYFEANYERTYNLNRIYNALVSDLIEEKIRTNDELQDRAHYAKMPLSGKFVLFACTMPSALHESIGRMEQEFITELIDSRIVPYMGKLLYIKCISTYDNEKDSIQATTDKLQPLLLKYNIMCGVSSVFQELNELHIAYKQAELALKYGERGGVISNDLLPFVNEPQRIYSFETAYPSGLFEHGAATWDILKNSKYGKALLALIDYDKKKGMNNFKLLALYLFYERNSSVVGSVMHMHRNNVLYRIARIEEMTGLDLNCAETRFNLMVSYFYIYYSLK